jgi:hypothetical protein
MLHGLSRHFVHAAAPVAAAVAVLLTSLAAPRAALASEAPKAEAKGGKESGKEGGEAAAGGGEKAGLPPLNPADRLEPTPYYVHKWIPAPAFAATHLPDGETRTVAPVKGRAQVIMFLGSWDEGSQRLVSDVERLARRYRRLNADFVYVFVSDTLDDASAFIKEYNLPDGFLANHDVRAAFHNTDLPTIYVGDRRGWLTTRFVKADADSLKTLDGFLERVTAF